MQYDFRITWEVFSFIIFLIIISNIFTSWLLRTDLTMYNFESEPTYDENQHKNDRFRLLKNTTTSNLIFNILIQTLIFTLYCLCFRNDDSRKFEKDMKEPKYLVISDRIVPVTDTLIVLGDKTSPKIDTVSIETFYKYKEYKEQKK